MAEPVAAAQWLLSPHPAADRRTLRRGRPILPLLLDEPWVDIAHRLKIKIFASIRDAGTAVLLVEQDARSTLAIADRIDVLAHGRPAHQGAPKDLAADEKIWRVYLGVGTNRVAAQASGGFLPLTQRPGDGFSSQASRRGRPVQPRKR